ncbi:MAG: acyltransferase family protein, partial [Tannerella sp.]|nr:acyltransferase family protein [Tannerella sp.]
MNNITLLSSNPPNRDITIDIAKGIAILLVVLGHLQNPINKYIYAFHMPLFFFLSGMFVKEMSLKDTICQNGYRLLLPFIFYYLYAVLMKIGRLFLSGKFTIESLWFTNIDSVFYNIGPIWFLLSLFYIFVLWSLLSKCSIRIRYINLLAELNYKRFMFKKLCILLIFSKLKVNKLLID